MISERLTGMIYMGKNSLTGFNQQVHIPDTTNAVLQFDAYQKHSMVFLQVLVSRIN